MPQPIVLNPDDYTGDLKPFALAINQQAAEIAALKKAAKAASSKKK